MIQSSVETTEQLFVLEKRFFINLYIPIEYEILRKKSFVLGRIAAKISIDALDPSFGQSQDVSIQFVRGSLGNPLILYQDKASAIRVCITHDQNVGICIANEGQDPVGVDFCVMTPQREAAFQKITTPQENVLLDDAHSRCIFWCAKEAISKAIGCGRHVRTSILTISHLQKIGVDSYEIGYENFPGFVGIFVHHYNKGLCVVLPQKCVEEKMDHFVAWMQQVLEQIS